MAENNRSCFGDYVRRVVEKLVEELGIKNCKLSIIPGTQHGDNYLGVISKVTVTGQTKSGKRKVLNLIVKCAPTNETFRSVMPIRAAYDREIYAYTKLFPEFQKIQAERGISKPLECFAKMHTATMKEANEALIMEDMKELGYMMLNRRKPLDYNHTLLVLKEYGRLHALSYALRDQKPTLFRELLDNTQETFFSLFEDFKDGNKGIESTTNRALDALDPVTHKIAYDKFNNFIEKVYTTIKFVLDCDAAGEYAVVGHGDSWMNNILFKYKKSAAPSALCFLDWQLARAGSPALDLSYFIFTCTDGELRAQHYDSLIQEYYNSLSSFLRELGSDPDKLLPFSVLQEHLKKFSVYGLYMSIMVLYLITSDLKDIPDVHNVNDREDALNKWAYESKNLAEFQKRAKDVILDFVSYGYDL